MKPFAVAIIILAIAVTGGLGYRYFARPPQPAATSTASVASPSVPTTPAPAAATITHTDAGFSPSTITIAKGTVVIFKNQASGAFWPASNAHPTHTLYDGTTLREHCTNPASHAFDACRSMPPGASWPFTFDKTGTWHYHDHLNPGEGGTVIVR